MATEKTRENQWRHAKFMRPAQNLNIANLLFTDLGQNPPKFEY